MKPFFHAACLLLLASALWGQMSVTLPGGFENGTVRSAPLPGTPEASPQGALAMASLHGTVYPGDFLLLSAQSNRFGPYSYRTDAIIGSERFPYTLQVVSDKEFRLADPRKNVMLGPFRYETGTTVAFDQATLSVLRLPSQVIVTLAPRGRQSREPTLAIAPLTPAVARSLTQLRATFTTIFNRLSGELATRSIEGAPIIRDAYGKVYDGTVKPSLRDRENARRHAETTVGLLLDKFQGDEMSRRAECTGNLAYRFAGLPPGNYVLCALWRVQERDALSVAPAALEVWWTPFQIGAQEKLAFTLTADNACGWMGIFQFPKFE